MNESKLFRIFGAIILGLGIVIAVLLADNPDPVASPIIAVSETVASSDSDRQAGKVIESKIVSVTPQQAQASYNESRSVLAEEASNAALRTDISAQPVNSESQGEKGFFRKMLDSVVEFVGKDRVFNITIDGSIPALLTNNSQQSENPSTILSGQTVIVDDQSGLTEVYDDGSVKSNCPDFVNKDDVYARNMLITMGCPLSP